VPAKQGDVYWAELDPTRGREQRGRRPVLVVSRDEINRLPLTVLVMIGTSASHLDPAHRFPTDLWVTARESGLPKDTVFLGLQMRSLDPLRLTHRIGSLPETRIRELWSAVRYLIGDDRAWQ